MRSDKEEKRLFLQACQKAGLKVHSVSGERPAAGLVIRDAQGHRFIVNEDVQIVSVGVANAGVDLNRRTAAGGMRTHTTVVQRAGRTYPRKGQSRARRMRGKVNMKQSG